MKNKEMAWAWLRLLIPIWMVTFSYFQYLRDMSRGPKEIIFAVGPMKYDFLFQFMLEHFQIVVVCFYVFAFLVFIGFFTFWSWIAWGITSFLLTSFENSFGHAFNLASYHAFFFFIMAFAPTGQKLSLDQLLGLKNISASSWLVEKALTFFIAWNYFAAGSTKIWQSGFDWISGNAVGLYLFEASITRMHNLQGQLWENWGLVLSQNSSLGIFVSFLIILFEMGWILFIFTDKGKWFWCFLTLVFQLSVWILMGIKFTIGLLPLLIVFYFSFEDSRLRKYLKTLSQGIQKT